MYFDPIQRMFASGNVSVSGLLPCCKNGSTGLCYGNVGQLSEKVFETPVSTIAFGDKHHLHTQPYLNNKPVWGFRTTVTSIVA